MRSVLAASLAALLALAMTLLAGCASIVHGGPRSVPVTSTPSGAAVSIFDRSGLEVQKHTTPFTAQLTTRYKYFSGQSYRLVFEMPGYQKSEVQLTPKLSGWYWGNLVFGGLLGMLVVDPHTGAMYNLSPDKVEHALTEEQKAAMRKGTAIFVILVQDATLSELAAMTPIPAEAVTVSPLATVN